jgi:hypothetical protein
LRSCGACRRKTSDALNAYGANFFGRNTNANIYNNLDAFKNAFCKAFKTVPFAGRFNE